MKKRLLSVLLLLAMLLTMVPVASAAEEAKTNVENTTTESSESYPDLYTYYVQDGLVALYTAFSDDGSVNLLTGQWANKVAGGAPAILRDESKAGNYWTKYAMGIGYSMTVDQFKTAATATPDRLGDGRKVGITLSDAYNTDNFTVDAFAKVVGITNEDGTVYVSSGEGNLFNANISAFRFDLAGGLFFAGLRGGTVSGDKIYDYYKTPNQPNSWSWGYSSSLATRWYVQNVGFKNANPVAPSKYFDGTYQDNGWLMTRGHASDADCDQTVPTAGVIHLEKTTLLGATREETSIKYRVTYNNEAKLNYNGLTEMTATLTGTLYDEIKAADTRTDTNEYADGDISLFNGVPGEIYAIRVYNRALNENEKAMNRLIDLVYYHGAELPALFYTDAVVRQTVAATANQMVISEDAAKKAANKATLEAAVSSIAVRQEILSSYAATEDLVAFFTAYDKTTINLDSGTWTDIVSGSVATFENKTEWAIRENGSVGFDAWAGYMKGGVYTAGKTGFTGNTAAYAIDKTIRLQLDINMLPDEDFTVEYLTANRPLLIADADKTAANGKVVYYEEGGSPVAIFDYAVANGYTTANAGQTKFIPQSASNRAGDQIGFFGNHTQQIDGFGGWGTAPRGTAYWLFGTAYFGNPTNEAGVGGGGFPTTTTKGDSDGLAKSGDAWRVAGGATFNTYSVSVDETVKGTDTEALFALYRDGAFYADNSKAVNSTANNAAADVCKNSYYYFVGSDNRIYYKSGSTYYDDLTGAAKPDSVTVGSQKGEDWSTSYFAGDYTEFIGNYKQGRHGFWLSAGVPTDFLSVRVYDRVLTQEERELNTLVDILMYYGASVDAKLLADASFVSELVYTLSNFTGAQIVTDAAQKTAISAKIKATVNDLASAVEGAKKNDYASLYVSESETGAKLLGLYTAFGEYTVDFANGTWKNEVVGGADAIIRDNGSEKYWHRDGKGIGYTFNYKVAIKRTSAGTDVGVNDYVSPNDDWDEVGIKLPDSYAELENFTVESFATMVGATDDTGARWQRTGQMYTTIANFRFGLLSTVGFQGLCWLKDANGNITGYYYTPVNGTRTSYSGSSLALRWLMSNTATASIAGENKDDLAPVRVGDGEANHLIPVASVLQVEKATSTDAVNYKISYNNETTQMSSWGDFRSYTLTLAKEEYETRAAKDYGTIDKKTGAFSLFNDWASTVYAIRVYDGALTATEKAQNRLVDLMYYHGIDVVDSLYNDEVMEMAIAVADSITIATDAAKFAANKAKIEASVKSASVKIEMLASYAAVDNLTAFFTAEDTATISLENGTWTSIVGGVKATFEGKTNWKMHGDFVGFDAWAGYMKDGVYTVGKTGFTGDTTAYVSNKYGLNIGVDNLSDEDFTVEYTVLYRPLLIADADKTAAGGEVVYYTDSAGQPVAIFDYAVANGYAYSNAAQTKFIPQCASSKAGDMFGFFGNHTQQIDGFGGWGNPAPRGSAYWTVGLAYFGNPMNYFFVGGGWATTSAAATDRGLAKTDDAFRVTGGKSFNTYGVTVDETVKGNDTEALFTIYRDGIFYADNSANINSTANNAAANIVKDTDANGNPIVDANGYLIYTYFVGSDGEIYYKVGDTYYNNETGAAKANDITVGSTKYEEWGTAYYDCDYSELMGNYKQARHGFWLSAGIPSDFYAVRVYDRVLTDGEKLHNRLMDVLYFYDLTLPAEILADEALLHEVAIAASSITISSDALAKAAAKLQVEDAVKHVLSAGEAYDLYVADGLVAQFSALSAGELSASVENGVWHNRIAGSKNAVFGNSTNWKRNANGSVGFTLFAGMIGDDGVYTLTSDYNNYNVAGTKLDLGKELLPTDNFTLEYVAQHNPIYVADKFGNIYVEADGSYAENFDYNFKIVDDGSDEGKTVYNVADSRSVNSPVFRIGYLQGWTTNRDGMHTDSVARGDLAWTVSSADDWYRSQTAQIRPSTTLPVRDAYAINGSVHTYAITRTEDAKTDVYKGTYTLLRDTVIHSLFNVDGSIKVSESLASVGYERADFTKADALYAKANASGVVTEKTGFYLADGTPTDFYAVRVYNRVLSAAELAQNHFADIVLYYDLTFDEAIIGNETILAALATAFVDAKIVTDAAQKTANKVAYQALITKTIEASEYVSTGYDALYIQDGLVGLFTAFEGDTSVDLFNGVWKNKATAGYENATLKLGAQYWRRETFGVGYSMNATQWKTDGRKIGIALDDSYEDLEEFTVETFATMVGLTDSNGNRIIADGESVVDGVKLSASYYNNGYSGFRFGMLATLTFAALSTRGGESLLNRWAISNIGFPGGTWKEGAAGNYQGLNIKNASGTSDTGWRLRGDGYTPLPALMQVSKAVTKVNNAVTEIAYEIAYDSKAPVMQQSISYQDYLEYAAYENTSFAEGEGRRFNLFNGIPAEVYAIRVYNRVLSAEEKSYNSFVDKAAWYRLDVTGFADLDEDVKETILSIFADVDYTRDAATIQAIYNFNVKSETADEMAESTISFKEIKPILSEANGFRAYFELNKTAYDLFVANGYEVTYGALVAPAGKTVELGAAGVMDIVVGGNDGSYIFKEFGGAGGYLYTAAVTAANVAHYGVDMVVRGYIKAVKGGEEIVCYDNAIFNGSEQVSILDVADYFVNYYNGDVASQYMYMNNAHLRQILADCGYAARVTVGDKLTLWVDAVDGKDTNDGLTASTAYASLETAFAAAKAHFGKTGTKSVTIRLAAGTYYVTEELALTADDVALLDAYSFEVIGEGETTILSSEVEIDISDVQYDEDEALHYVQLPQNEDGSYPHFRAVYGDGKLLDIAHRGDGEETWDIQDFWIVDGDGNKLEIVRGFDTDLDGDIDEKDVINTDWIISDEDKLIAEYAVYKLPAEMFDLDMLEYYGGTELHISQLWESNITHIDYVELDDSGDYVLAYVPYGQMPHVYTNAKVKGQICWLANSVQLAYETGDYFYNEETGRLYWYSENEEGFYSVDKLAYAGLSSMFRFDNVENITVKNLAITGLDTKYIAPDVCVDQTQSGAITLRWHEQIVTNQSAIDKDPTVEPVYAWKTQSVGYQTEGAVAGKNVIGLTVEGIKVYDTLSGGIVINNYLEDAQILSNSFTNLGAGGIQIGGTNAGYVKNVLVENNYVNSIGKVYKAVAGILISDAANLRVIGNTVVNTPWSAFSLGNSFTSVQSTLDQIIGGGDFGLFNVEIAYNYAANFMTSQHDGGAFYMNGRTVVPDTDHDGRYNFMHHNYVVMDVESGLTGDDQYSTADKDRVVYCYYFETGSNNWLVYENVLVNEVNDDYANALFYGMFLQAYKDCQARDMTLTNNYYLNYSELKYVYRLHWSNPDPSFNQEAIDDYMFASVADLAAGNGIVDTHNNGNTTTAPANSGEIVAGIFAAAGSTLSNVDKNAFLTYEKDGETVDLTKDVVAPERVLGTDGEYVNINDYTDLALKTVTFTDGKDITLKVSGLEGASVSVPGAFAQEGYTYTFKLNGEVIDINEFKIPATNVTILVDAKAETREVTIRGGANGDVTIDVEIGSLIVIPEELMLEGKDIVVTYNGAVVDLATFKMPAEALELRISYTDKKYLVSFDDGEGNTPFYSGVFGAGVNVDMKHFEKEYMHPVFYLDGEEIDINNFKIPARDVLITVEYEYNTYRVYFKSDITFGNETVTLDNGYVDVKFGDVIRLPKKLENIEDYTEFEGYVFSYTGKWADFESGKTVLGAEHIADEIVFWAVWDYTEVGAYATGDINGDDMITAADINLLIQVFKNSVADASAVKGDADVNGDGLVTAADINALIKLFKTGSL